MKKIFHLLQNKLLEKDVLKWKFVARQVKEKEKLMSRLKKYVFSKEKLKISHRKEINCYDKNNIFYQVINFNN